MYIAGLMASFLAIIGFEVPGLVKKKMWRELAAFTVLLIPGMYMAFALTLDWPVPDITAWLDKIFLPLSNMIVSLLK